MTDCGSQLFLLLANFPVSFFLVRIVTCINLNWPSGLNEYSVVNDHLFFFNGL